MLSPAGAASRAIFRTLRTPSTTASVEAPPAPAVFPHDVLLHRPAVVRLADIPHEHGLPVDVFDRNIVELGDGRRHRIGAHRVLRVADLGETRRQSQVLRVDCVDDIRRREPFGLELDRVDVDHDLPVLAAVGSWEGHARDRSELLAQIVDPVIVELLFIERVRAQAELQDRNARGVVRHHGRWLYAGRHQGADRICRRDDLGDREIEVHSRLEIDLLDRDAVECLRLHIFDAVDVRADGVLAIGGDALLHLRRAEAGVLPDHRDDRNVDFRKDVYRHHRNSREPEK